MNSTTDSLKPYQDSPDTLINLCTREIIELPIDLCRHVLPSELGHLLTKKFREIALANRADSQDCNRFFRRLKHKHIPLHKIDFSALPITERVFMKFLEEYQDQLDEINISSCPKLANVDQRRFNELLKNGRKQHKTLIIGDTFSEKQHISFDEDLELKKLVLHKVNSSREVDEFSINRQLSEFLTPTMSYSLKYLDLSLCSVGRGSALMQLESLEILILYNCVMTYPDVVSTICQLKKLRVLDLSRLVLEPEDPTSSAEDQKLLDLLVSRLPNLNRLDISGTNLVGGKDRYISAFETRMEKPFEFLGLFHTGNDAAYRSCIPAAIVAGEATESQMLNACEAYMDRPNQLAKALSDLYNFYKTITPSETFDGVNRALDIALYILTRHLNEEQVITFTTAVLWCIVKITVASKNLNDAKVRRTITSRLLDVMHYHKSSRVILVNGVFILLLYPEFICEHSRVASISLFMCRDSDARTQQIGTTLLNTLACQVEGDQKIFIGNLQAIETMLYIIKSKIDENTCDETLETAWSTLWNITDETPVNCRKFLHCEGLKAFEKCMDNFGDNKEVLRNIMGLLGNVAECKELRTHFMRVGYIHRFYTLLSSNIDGIECSYNACGILAHLVSEGEEFWNYELDSRAKYFKEFCTREVHLEAMRNSIASWPINSKRNINYRSFEPIVRLLDIGIAAEAQYWAVFAVTNLMRIYPAKYCPMLLPHEGLSRLRKLVPGTTAPFVSDLVKVALYQYDTFEAKGTLAGLEQCDSIDLEVMKNFRAEPNYGDGASEGGELLL